MDENNDTEIDQIGFPSARTAAVADLLEAMRYPKYKLLSLASNQQMLREDELYELLRFLARHWQPIPD